MATLRSDTRTVRIDEDPRTVFAFLSDVSSLPRWAIHFCKGIERRDGSWIVTTAQGELPMRVVADEETGVIDFWMSSAPGIELPARSRVVANGDGAEYMLRSSASRTCPSRRSTPNRTTSSRSSMC